MGERPRLRFGIESTFGQHIGSVKDSDVSDYRDWLALNLVPGLGAKWFLQLLTKFSSPSEVLKASKKALRAVPGLSEELIDRIKNYRSMIDLDRELQLIEKFGVEVVTLVDDRYPPNLALISDPPVLLYVRGDLLERDKNAVAVVGTRRPSTYGRLTAERIAGELVVQGLTVVSGMAVGIDTAAHRGALRKGGRTVAVLGSGVDVTYPSSNRKLREEICQQGALISEFPMSTKPLPGHFPIRNRIISGLSLGTLVVEGRLKSGALITANCAVGENREVFAVPGDVNSPRTDGPHSLIRDGAKLVESAYDIMEEIGSRLEFAEGEKPFVGPSDRPAREFTLSENEKKIFNFLSMEPTHIDAVIGECGLTSAQVSSALMTLEIKNLVRQLSGKYFVRI